MYQEIDLILFKRFQVCYLLAYKILKRGKQDTNDLEEYYFAVKNEFKTRGTSDRFMNLARTFSQIKT